jgi:Family of unknown function (DUF5956)
MWTDVSVVESNSDRWAELEENGWGALIGWAAGTANLRRRPSSDEGRSVTVTVERGGAAIASVEPFTTDDRIIVDDSIDEYLQEAGVPARPRGWVWLIRVPENYPSGQAFLDRINTELNSSQPAPVRPSGWLAVMQEVVGRLYEGG